jgi:GNAT superfamily N-acetyltransferase
MPVNLSPGLSLSLEERPSLADCEAVAQGLAEYNRSHLADPGYAPLGIFVRDAAGKVVAGLDAAVYGGWLFVHALWVAAGLRRCGIGSELLARAEGYAVGHGCHSAWLYTYSFQAPEFYRRLGYEVFGTLDAPDHQRIFLKKHFAPGASGQLPA